MNATIDIVPSVLDRIRKTLVGLKMPRALEVLDQTVRQLERGEASALEVIDTLFAEELTLRENRRVKMALRMAKLSKLELQVMNALWTLGRASVREIQETFAEKVRPAYTTVQTMVYRLEGKQAVRRVRKIGNAHVFEAVITRSSAQRRVVDDLLAFFGGRSQPLMAQLVESGHLTLDDVKEAERLIKRQKAAKP